MAQVQTVEILENEDIILVHNGKVVGLIINSTLTLNGQTGYHFTGRPVAHIDKSKDAWSQNRYSFTAGTEFHIDSAAVGDFIKDHVVTSR